ncbi:MAG: hypothetical protein H8E14_10475 [Candidatus Marinimicrobia bacterium]|nr:hypothetical protein [Candidatus Neomarinimicrobiota bacterium]
MKCPKCDLFNPDSAIRCDCGYDFKTDRIEKTYLSNNKSNADIKSSKINITKDQKIKIVSFLVSILLVILIWNWVDNLFDSPVNDVVHNENYKEYKVVSKKDISYTKDDKKIVRTDIRVSVNGLKSESELRKISENIILKLVKKSPQNAVSILFYLPGSNTSSFYTAGMVEWAPYGDWGKAGLTKTGNYSKHQYTIKVGGAMGKIVEPTNTNLSVSKRQEIFYNLVKLQDSGFDSGKSYSVIASRYNIEESLVKK